MYFFKFSYTVNIFSMLVTLLRFVSSFFLINMPRYLEKIYLIVLFFYQTCATQKWTLQKQ